MYDSQKPVVLTVLETQQVLRVRRAKIYELIKDGTLEALKVGNSWRVKIESVERLVGRIPQKFFADAA